MLKKIKTKNKLITLCVLLLVLAAVVFVLVGFTESGRPAQIPEKLKKESMEVLEAKFPSMIKLYGVGPTLDWVREGFANEEITMFECHTFFHYIGHLSLRYYKGDVDSALEGKALDRCEGGYVHGVEAQLVESGGDYRPRLFQICSLLLRENIPGGCYHGAGHAFMRPDNTPEEAVEFCNKLSDGPTNSLDSCYNGVFSEYTNLIGGSNGHTGLPLANGPAFEFKGPAIKFCSSFKERYQIPCALEVSGFGFGPQSSAQKIEASMHECAEPGYSAALQAACMESMAAVSSQHGLPLQQHVKPPEFIFSLPSHLRQAYIKGVSTETKQFIYNGQEKDWQVFCSFFPEKTDTTFCESLFQKSR